MHYGALFQPAIPKTWQECFYTALYRAIANLLKCLSDPRLRGTGREGPHSGVRVGPRPGTLHTPRDLLGADEPQGGGLKLHFQISICFKLISICKMSSCNGSMGGTKCLILWAEKRKFQPVSPKPGVTDPGLSINRPIRTFSSPGPYLLLYGADGESQQLLQDVHHMDQREDQEDVRGAQHV